MPLSQIIVQLNPDTMPSGSDLSVVNAARKSFGKRSEWDVVTSNDVVYDYDSNSMVGRVSSELQLKPQDKRLIEYLARGMTADDFEAFLEKLDRCTLDGEDEEYEVTKQLLWAWRHTPEHTSPFGHCFLSFGVKLPIFLARQLVKHKFLRWSEYSRRYITDDVEFYIHDYREKSEDKKQGSGGLHEGNTHWQRKAELHNQSQLDLYNSMIDDGVAPEQARGVLPADLMTAVTWSGSLDAWADMCKLRLGSDAQKEAQYVAQEVYKVLKEYYPVSAKCLVEGV